MMSDTPKVLHRVAGRPILQYVLDVAKSAGSLKTYIIVGHKSEEVRNYLGKRYTAIEQKRLLGTADAVRCTQKYLKNYKGDVLILCGDTPLLTSDIIQKIVRKHASSQAACTFLTAVVHEPQGYGRIIRDDYGRAVVIREDKDAVGLEREIEEINVGVYCVKCPELLEALREIKLNEKKKEFYLTDMVDIMAQKKKKIETVETEDFAQGLGVNSRQDLATAESVLRKRILNQLMAEGVTIVDPATTYIHGNVKIGKDTVIRPFTFIEENVRIGKRCVIGPFARLRPGTKIGDEVEIGNFTEISRSKIGRKVFVKHFSFLGDAVIGAHVNIGAGTVTANFDGVKKNVTKILDGAFIGSNSVLVAPVKIGKKAIIGAGSVVTKGYNIPDRAVAVGIPARVVSKRKAKG